MTGGTITAGTANGSSGAVNVTGGDLTLATAETTDGISFGGGEGGYGAFTISGGTFTQQRFMFGGTGSTTALGGVGVGLITGGTVNSTGWLILSRAGASTGILTVNGGLLNHSGASNDLAVGLAGSGRAELNMGGGLLDNTGRRVTFSGGTGGTFHWSGTGLVNLNGGTLLTNSITYDTAVSPFSPNANSYVNFGGGTLKAASSSASFFPAHTPAGTGVSQVYVNGAFGSFTGGAIIDTNGFDPTISVNFLAPTGNGVTGLTIDNAGSGYVGAPAVKILDGGLPSTATAYAVVGTDPAVPATFGKVTSVVITNPGVITGTPTVSLVGGGGTGAAISVASTGPNTSGGLTKTGSGQLTLTGNSTYTGLTSVTTGTLAVAGAGTLAATSGLSVSSGAGFSFLPTVPAALTLGAGSTLSLANNSTITTTFDSSIAVAGAATNSGSVNIALSGAFTSGNTYTVLTAAGGLDSSTYKVLNPSSFTYTTNATPTAVTITPITATPLAAAYWIGGFSGLPGVWSASDGSGAGNWTTDGLGTASPLVPGPTANVFFSDASASAGVQAAMSLGSNMSVGSLTFNSTNPATLLNTDASVLSLASGLTVNAPAAAVTLSANIATTAAQSWTNNSANPLITGLVSNGANLLTLSGSGNTTIGNFNGGTGGLTVDSTGFTTLGASTLAGAQTWTNNSVNTLTAGAIANAGFALTLAGTGNFELGGVVSGAGTLTKAGGGTATLSAANTYTGATTVAEGILTLSGPRTGNSGAITLGTAGLNTTLNISSGTYNMGGNRINVGNSSTTAATATVNQTGGAVSFTGSDQLLLGLNTFGNQGIYNMSGGSITTAANVARGVMLGVNSNPAPGPASGGGTFNLSGSGVLNMTAASGGGGNAILQIGRSDAIANNTTNVFNQTGGTANVGILGMGGAAAGSAGVSSTLTITAGTFSANSFTILAAGGTNDATINIGGTADVTLPAFPTARGASSTATLNLDGGTLRPSAASATYISGLTDAFIKAGGANFDVPTGRNITVSQSLLTDGVSLGGGLSKSNAGVLTLSGTNTYTGLTTVTGGGLVARNLASLPGISTLHQISLSGISTLTLGVGGVGEFTSTDVDSVLTNADFATGAILGLDTANAAAGFTYATNITNATGVAGTSLGLTKSGANTLILSGANTYSGPTTITAGILQVGATTNLGDASPTNSLNLSGGTFSSGSSTFTLDNSRAVNITAATGFRSESGGVLTIDTDLANGANNIALTGAGSIVVNGVIGTGVTPTGALTIGGATALPANVTLNGNNLFTGNVTLPAPNTQPFSVLTVTNSGALGVGPKTVASQGGGEIHLQNNITLAANISFTTSGNSSRAVISNDSGNNTINGNISMSSGNGGTVISSDSGLLTLNGNLAATAADRDLRLRGNGNGVINGVIANGSTANLPVLKDGGNGTWTLNGANTYSGATTVSVGTLALGNAAALGTGAAVVNGGLLDLGGQTVANAVTVNSAGTLTGSGSTGAATLAGTVTPGGSGSGLITVASATVAATSNLALQLGGTGTRGTAYDAVTVNSALALDGTITVTLNGLVPAATQTFDLIDSTGAINVAGFNVNTDLILPALDTGLAWDTSTFATNGQITVVVDLDPFGAWATANSVEGGKGGDEDGDGTTNLMEFATNADPQSGSSGARVYGLVHPIGGTPVLTYTVATRAAAIFAANGSRQEATKDFVKYSIEGTNDLSIWNSVVVTEVTGVDATAVRAAIVPALPTLDSGWEWHTFRTDGNTAVDPSDFIRLNVTEAP
jgi:autotransporter-associated beta strand protein